MGELQCTHQAGGHHGDAHVHGLGSRVHQGIEYHIGHVGKDRDTDDETGQCQRQRHTVAAHQIYHGAGDDLDGTGVFQGLGDYRTQHDYYTDRAEGIAEATLKGVDEIVLLHARQNAEQHDWNQECKKYMPLPFGDQK